MKMLFTYKINRIVILLFLITTVSVFADDNVNINENSFTDKKVIYYEYSFYASVKYLQSLFYELGTQSYGNIEIGSSIRKFFLTADFSFAKYEPEYWTQMRYGFGFSGGGRIPVTNWLSIVLGGYLGFFNIDPYSNETYYGREYINNYKLVTIAANTKFIFGPRKIKFEISNKFVFLFGHQGSVGIVYMATKKVAGRNYR